jgi:hypothetical protein
VPLMIFSCTLERSDCSASTSFGHIVPKAMVKPKAKPYYVGFACCCFVRLWMVGRAGYKLSMGRLREPPRNPFCSKFRQISLFHALRASVMEW